MHPAVAVVADALALLASFVAAYGLAFAAAAALGLGYSEPDKVFAERAVPFMLTATLSLAWFMAQGHYHSRSTFWEEARIVFAACTFSMLTEGFFLFAWKADASRLATLFTWSLAPFMVMGGRMLVRRILGDRRLAAAIVFGRPDEAGKAAKALTADMHLGYSVAGMSEILPPSLARIRAEEAGADTVVVALSGDDASEAVLAASMKEAGFSVILVPKVVGFPASGLRTQYIMGQETLLLLDRADVAPQLSRGMKRLFDVLVTSAMLTAAAVPMLIVASLVKRDGGPAIFGHERIGNGGIPFKCLKFRSMATDADARLKALIEDDADAREEWERSRKLKNDPRVTRIGRFIRKTALDELPQLINVLKGDMSLVGPRPVTRSEMAMYGEAATLYESVRPGVTGLWQVSGRNDLSYEERVSLDTWYVRNWSPWHDIAILLKTVPALLSRRGAY